jgi:hypothetical protein
MNKIRYPQPVDLKPFGRDNAEPEAFYGLPSKVAYCKSCVISNQRPNSAVEYKHTKQTKKATINFVMPAPSPSVNARLSIGMIEKSNWLIYAISIGKKMDPTTALCLVPGGRTVSMHRIF